jgi:cell division protein FtsB
VKFLDRIPAFLKNRYFLVGFSFLMWLSFFDNYNFFFHAELIDQKNELKAEFLRLKKETVKNQIFLRNLNNAEFMEKYARERYLMKKDGEDVFIIEKE